jgi:hypothetical protein
MVVFFLNRLNLISETDVGIWVESGYANRPIGGLEDAIQENGVPG